MRTSVMLGQGEWWSGALTPYVFVVYPLGIDVHVRELTGLPNASFNWSISGCGEIVGSSVGETINVRSLAMCGCNINLTATTTAGECCMRTSPNIRLRHGSSSNCERRFPGTRRRNTSSVIGTASSPLEFVESSNRWVSRSSKQLSGAPGKMVRPKDGSDACANHCSIM